MVLFRNIPKPGDVSKLFPDECRYLGGPTESIRRRLQIFPNDCDLCVVDESMKQIMFPLM